jgi:uncharacterized LabA/DUF88 family protein
MDRTAIFVDAGYLFAQGSTALKGSKVARTNLVLDATKALEALKAAARLKAPDSQLLRVYWYDGATGGIRPTTDQAVVANLDDVKLRLGFVNHLGQQKGVDSLIVTDLIELARLKSISDAVLLSGDEDVRVGVQIAQSYGVRVHLLGIAPSRGSQSHQLLQEADTTSEWAADVVRTFLSVREDNEDKPPQIDQIVEKTAAVTVTGQTGAALAKIEVAVQSFVAGLAEADIQGIGAYWETARGVPADLDRRMLPICGQAIERNLDRHEMRHMRACFQERLPEGSK